MQSLAHGVCKCKACGSVSLFFALMLSLVLALLFVLRNGLEMSTRQLQIEYAMNASMNAAFAEYHQELLKQYDILAIDTSYGTTGYEVQNTAEHVRRYMDGNFGYRLFGNNDMLGLKAEDAEVYSVSRLTEGQGNVLEYQILSYMHSLTGLPDWGYTEEQAKDYERGMEDNPVESLWGQANGELAAQELPTVENEDGETEEVALENPADAVWSLKSLGIIKLVIEDEDSISQETLAQEDLVSERSCMQDACADTVLYNFNLADKMLLQEYLFQKMGCYTEQLEKSRLKYQIEYLLCGERRDYDNLQHCANRLSLLRFLFNYRYLSNSTVKTAEAKALALALTAVAMQPSLEPFVTRTLLFAWAYVESVQDVKSLLEGGKVPLQKTDSDWKTGIAGLANFHENLEGGGGGSGLDYKGYLRIMLCLVSEEKLRLRMMDLIESDIRKTKGNESFRLDGCIVSLDLGVTVSAGDDSFYIRRKFSYDE